MRSSKVAENPTFRLGKVVIPDGFPGIRLEEAALSGPPRPLEPLGPLGGELVAAPEAAVARAVESTDQPRDPQAPRS